MKTTPANNPAANKAITRRQALLRLGFGAFAAYSAPAFMTLSQARAKGGSGSSGSGGGSGSSGSGGGSGSSGSSDASAPSGTNNSGSGNSNSTESANVGDGGSQPSSCENPRDGGSSAAISRNDYRQARIAVSRGDALPLRDVVASVRQQLGGKFIEVRFLDQAPNAIYDFRMISGNGNLVAVRVQAATGRILNVAGC